MSETPTYREAGGFEGASSIDTENLLTQQQALSQVAGLQQVYELSLLDEAERAEQGALISSSVNSSANAGNDDGVDGVEGDDVEGTDVIKPTIPEGTPATLDYEDFNKRVDDVWDKTNWESSEPKSLSFFKSVSMLTAGIIGCGALGLPATMYFSGFLGFVIIALYVVYTSYLGGIYLGQAGRLTGKSNMMDIAEASLGPAGKGLAIFALVGLVFLASIAYAILWYMFCGPVFSTWFNIEKETLQAGGGKEGGGISFFCFRSLVIAVLLGIQLPICLPRKLSVLSYVSTAGVSIFVALWFAIIGLYFGDYLGQNKSDWNFRDPWTPKPKLSERLAQNILDETDFERLNHPCNSEFNHKLSWGFGPDFMGMLITLAILGTSFNCHFSVVDIFVNELKQPTDKRQKGVMASTLGIAFVFYFLFAFFGEQYGEKFQKYDLDTKMCLQGAQSSIIGNMNAEGKDKSPLIELLSSIGMFLVLYLSFPLFISALRGSLHGLVFKEESSFMLHLLETVGLLFLIFIATILLPDILQVMGYAGAGPGAVLVYILPSLMVFWLNKDRLPWSHAGKWQPFALLILSTIVSIMSLFIVVTSGDRMAQLANVKLDGEHKNTETTIFGPDVKNPSFPKAPDGIDVASELSDEKKKLAVNREIKWWVVDEQSSVDEDGKETIVSYVSDIEVVSIDEKIRRFEELEIQVTSLTKLLEAEKAYKPLADGKKRKELKEQFTGLAKKWLNARLAMGWVKDLPKAHPRHADQEALKKIKEDAEILYKCAKEYRSKAFRNELFELYDKSWSPKAKVAKLGADLFFEGKIETFISKAKFQLMRVKRLPVTTEILALREAAEAEENAEKKADLKEQMFKLVKERVNSDFEKIHSSDGKAKEFLQEASESKTWTDEQWLEFYFSNPAMQASRKKVCIGMFHELTLEPQKSQIVDHLIGFFRKWFEEKDIIKAGDSKEEATKAVRKYLEDEEQKRRATEKALREARKKCEESDPKAKEANLKDFAARARPWLAERRKTEDEKEEVKNWDDEKVLQEWDKVWAPKP